LEPVHLASKCLQRIGSYLPVKIKSSASSLKG
jgi:hypothetical protein